MSRYSTHMQPRFEEAEPVVPVVEYRSQCAADVGITRGMQLTRKAPRGCYFCEGQLLKGTLVLEYQYSLANFALKMHVGRACEMEAFSR